MQPAAGMCTVPISKIDDYVCQEAIQRLKTVASPDSPPNSVIQLALKYVRELQQQRAELVSTSTPKDQQLDVTNLINLIKEFGLNKNIEFQPIDNIVVASQVTHLVLPWLYKCLCEAFQTEAKSKAPNLDKLRTMLTEIPQVRRFRFVECIFYDRKQEWASTLSSLALQPILSEVFDTNPSKSKDVYLRWFYLLLQGKDAGTLKESNFLALDSFRRRLLELYKDDPYMQEELSHKWITFLLSSQESIHRNALDMGINEFIRLKKFDADTLRSIFQKIDSRKEHRLYLNILPHAKTICDTISTKQGDSRLYALLGQWNRGNLSALVQVTDPKDYIDDASYLFINYNLTSYDIAFRTQSLPTWLTILAQSSLRTHFDHACTQIYALIPWVSATDHHVFVVQSLFDRATQSKFKMSPSVFEKLFFYVVSHTPNTRKGTMENFKYLARYEKIVSVDPSEKDNPARLGKLIDLVNARSHIFDKHAELTAMLKRCFNVP